MHPQGFQPFIETLKSKMNIVLLLLAAVFVADLFIGQPVVMRIIDLHFKIMHIDPTRQQFVLLTIFGTFHSVDAWALFMGRALAIIFIAIPGLSLFWGMVSSFTGK